MIKEQSEVCERREWEPSVAHIEMELFTGEAILFGSRKKGTARPDSDFDFLLIPSSSTLLHITDDYWGDASFSLWKKLKFESGIRQIYREICNSFHLPFDSELDVFLIVKWKETTTGVRLLWDEYHACFREDINFNCDFWDKVATYVPALKKVLAETVHTEVLKDV